MCTLCTVGRHLYNYIGTRGWSDDWDNCSMTKGVHYSVSPHAVHKLKEATTLKLSGITFVVALSTYHQCTTHPLTTRSEGELQDTAYVASARNYHLCDACLARRTYSVSPAQHNREREPWNMPLQPFEQLELTFGELTCLDIWSSCTSVPYRLSIRL